MAFVDLRDELNCSICLCIYTDPVTLSCGHNFCRGCIDCVLLSAHDQDGGYSCPDCRARFMGLPALQRNVALCAIAERFRSAQPEQSGEVFCTYCIHASIPAVKSCLHCEASLCSDHLIVHSRSSEHVLSEPSTAPKTRKCAVHKKILEYYCSKDSTLICVSCRLDGEHGGHSVESLDKASEKKRRQLFQLLQNLESKRSVMEKRFQSLEKRLSSVHEKEADMTKEITVMFQDIRRNLEELEKKVLIEVSRQEKQAVLSISELIQQMEVKKEEISKEIHHIEALCHTTDPITVLQEQLPCQRDLENGPTMVVKRDNQSHEVVGLCMDPISNGILALSDMVRNLTKGIYLQDPTDITLDVSTSGDHLTISDNLKVATCSERNNLPKTPERFECNQILSKEAFSSGVHYWDVEGSGSGMWRVGVCYPSMGRAGSKSIIGSNDRSWALEYFISEYSATHNDKEVCVSEDQSCCRLRVHLDYDAGQLSFYELGDPVKHLHTFSAIFTEPLHAAFWVGWDAVKTDSWVKIEDCELMDTSPSPICNPWVEARR
ncbi:E3 ubiquitin/ISG15 ligase TRIM25-like [Ranitomeya variabilis]|uniref:E3 ubiquitin/ISG15 ligase TRIM25-like n=1 Tax=Ranitomeya variabilis TaxID=490064 RepID=UPI00405603A2